MSTLVYEPLPPFAELQPGIEALEFNVVVYPRTLAEKTKGGIILSEPAKDRDDEAATDGVLVSVSPMAFSFAEWPAGKPHPQAGDHVLFARYAGTLVYGADGRRYRVMKDKDVIAQRTAALDVAKPAF